MSMTWPDIDAGLLAAVDRVRAETEVSRPWTPEPHATIARLTRERDDAIAKLAVTRDRLRRSLDMLER